MPVSIDGPTLLIFDFTGTALVGVLVSAFGIIFEFGNLMVFSCLRLLAAFLVLFVFGVLAALWRVGGL